jgi:3-deoxy-D-manno-octulosonic-acid transferase
MTLQSPGVIYRLISFLFLPLWLVHAIWHGHKQNFSGYLKLRLRGSKKRSMQPPLVWIHAASVGETEAVTPLIRALCNQGETILFTSFTATGYRTIQRNFGDSVEPGIIPIDIGWICAGFIQQRNIKLCLLMETELWPELLYQTARRGIPIVQLNARLSRKTLKSPRLIHSLLHRTIRYISLYLTRNDNDRENLIQLGAPQEKIKIIGNLKSAVDLSPNYPRIIERDYLLLASSHDTEESLLLAHRPASVEKLLIVIAPRHPTRSWAIQQQLSQLGIDYATRSLSQAVNPQTEVYLADTLGELKALMAHARIVIMGGSFDQSGGHNIIEPAGLGCPIITGPSDANIREDIELLGKDSGIIQAADIVVCWQKIEYLLSNPDQARALGKQACQAVSQKTGILEDYLTEIKPYL